MDQQYFMQQSMRWFGEQDTVSLADIRQAGCSAVVTALHHIPIGDVWTKAEILKRRDLINATGMQWKVVESLPVHEDIKKRSGNYERRIINYGESLRNLADCGVEVVTYNFMPVLDWLRTDISYSLPTGAKALYFNRIDFIVFDMYLLQRPGAEKDYSAIELETAAKQFAGMSPEKQGQLFSNAMLGLPGSSEAFTREQVLSALESYHHIDAALLKKNLVAFLEAVVPIATEAGIKLAIHPDDPPYSILGLPRIFSTAADLDELMAAFPASANGVCFCTGSFGARADNDLLSMLSKHRERVHFLHLRNTKRDLAGNFYEAEHLGGDTDMYAILELVWEIMQDRKISLPMRPDHGHEMLDDLHKKSYPGYSAIGRLKGLAELRGLEYAISRKA